ncbi:hypothetical protein A6R68_19569, partial [Neotoma lepida]
MWYLDPGTVDMGESKQGWQRDHLCWRLRHEPLHCCEYLDCGGGHHHGSGLPGLLWCCEREPLHASL